MSEPGRSIILWDCDGTLADSEVPAMRVAVETLIDRYGPPARFQGDSLEAKNVLATEWAGRHVRQMIKELADPIAGPNDFEVDLLTSELQVATLEALRGVAEVPGIRAVVTDAHFAGRTQAVVSSSERARVKACLEGAQLKRFFGDRVYSALDDLGRDLVKPAPDIYFHALAQLGANGTDDIVAVEDSPSGVRSAVGAGVKVFGFLGGSHIPGHLKRDRAESLLAEGAIDVADDAAGLAGLLGLGVWIDLTRNASPRPASVER